MSLNQASFFFFFEEKNYCIKERNITHQSLIKEFSFLFNFFSFVLKEK